ncbi:MAG: hypothetical protein EXR75_02135 [Myxococcales bacterium]|nr:hypothetical protein [Myxococcales bacterium]
MAACKVANWRGAIAACLGLSWAITGCRSELMRAAEISPASELEGDLAERLRQDEFDADDARDLARSRARYELRSASGDDGARALDGMSSCAFELRAEWLARAAVPDEVGAHAAIVATDRGLAEPLAYARFVSDERPAWRAAGARSLGVHEEPRGEPLETRDAALHATGVSAPKGRREVMLARAGWWRRHLMLDPYREVRRAALQAARDAGDPRDVGALFDAARRDPDSGNREAAIVALGRTASREAVLGLIDLWVTADEDARLKIVDAWAELASLAVTELEGAEARDVSMGVLASAQPRALAERQLWRVAESDLGMPSVHAAVAMLKRLQWNADPTALGIALGVVERAIDEAPTRIRVAAISAAPLRATVGPEGRTEPPTLAAARLIEAIVLASASTDPPVAVAALARMITLDKGDRDAALLALGARSKTVGLAAEAALAARIQARDASVLPALDALASGPSAITRGDAAVAFAAFGRFDKAARMLVDPAAQVRTRTACALLTRQ